MPLTYHILQDMKLVAVTHSGKIYDDEFLAAYQSFFEDPRFDTSFNHLIDLRQTDSSIRSVATLKEFADSVEKQCGGSEISRKIAVIAPQDVSFGLARIVEAFTQAMSWEFFVFRDQNAALSWLGMPEILPDDFKYDALPEP